MLIFEVTERRLLLFPSTIKTQQSPIINPSGPATKTQLDLSAVAHAYVPDAKDVFSLETALAARTNPGAPSTAIVTAEIGKWKGLLRS